MVTKKRNIYIFVTIFLLTLSHCVAYVGSKIESAFEYGGYFLLLGGILYSYFKASKKYRRKNTTRIVVLLFVLLVSGIILQNLPIMRKATLLFTVVAIIIVSTMSEKFIVNPHEFRIMAYSCLFSIFVSTIICLVLGVPLIKFTSEATFGMVYFFNGGIRDKNVATMLISIIMSLYIYSKERGKYRNIDKLTIGICLVGIIVANSRGAWIELFIFLVMLNYRMIGKIAKAHRWITILLLLVIIIPVVILFYNNFVMKSETYLYRYRGLINYITKFSSDAFHMVFGNAEMAYGQGIDYAIAVRSVTGWDGTIENAWLNILIKSGILGIIAYLIIFTRAIITAMKCEKLIYKTIYLAVTVTLIGSSFVAIYIQTVHGLFGIYSYLIMAYYSGIIRTNHYYKNTARVICL